MPYLPEYNPDTNYQTQQSAPQSNILPDQGQIPVASIACASGRAFSSRWGFSSKVFLLRH